MSNSVYQISSLQIQGFRAYLQPKSFDLSQKKCVSIFAPNGHGKSSMIDALEFLFSKEGTIDQLGLRAIGNNAGPAALAHFLADEKKIIPRVSVTISKGKVTLEGAREAGPGKRSKPETVAELSLCFAVSPIIRGHELRKFVEADTAEQRYEEFGGWLGVGALVEAQKNLRELRKGVRAAVEDRSAQIRIGKDLERGTDGVLAEWSDEAVIDHANETLLSPLDRELALKRFDRSDQAFTLVNERAKAEESQVGLGAFRHIRRVAARVYEETVNTRTGERAVAGALASFEKSAERRAVSEAAESAERDKAAKAAFANLWRMAEPLFAEGAAALDDCPVCATPIAKSGVESAEGVRKHLTGHLTELAEYAKASKELAEAIEAAAREKADVSALLLELANLLDDDRLQAQEACEAYRASVSAWVSGPTPCSKAIQSALIDLLIELDRSICEIEQRQGENTYIKAKAKIERLLDLKADWLLAERTTQELSEISEELEEQAAFITGEIRNKVQSMLDSLQGPANEIYRLIQGDRAVPLRLELPPETEKNQQRLHVFIDFAPNRPGVQPSGYLSDSQIHSVALALRIAAIKRFNAKAPIIALDDVVTSYDADHRRAIVGMLGTQCSDCQIIITTHDQRFFDYLKELLDPSSWQFQRIIRLDPDIGPIFDDYRVTGEMIEARWKSGQSAANEMRRAEEEWLLSICRGFGVAIRIRPLERPYAYDRGELASALAAFVKEAKLAPKLEEMAKNRFLATLQQGVVENFGSHFQDNPYAESSLGDEQVRWKEFKEFCGEFSCQKCGRTKFQRIGMMKRPTCAHPNCETQFEFPKNVEAVTGKAA